MLADRADRTRARMAEVGVDVLLLSVGPDLPYLTGYEAMPLERLTMLVLPREGDVALVAGLVGAAGSVAIGDRTWARFVLDLQAALPGAAFRRGSEVVGPLRAVKDPAEVESLRKAAAAADRVASQLHAGDIPLVGRTEAEVSADIGRRLVDAGPQRGDLPNVAPRAPPPH